MPRGIPVPLRIGSHYTTINFRDARISMYKVDEPRDCMCFLGVDWAFESRFCSYQMLDSVKRANGFPVSSRFGLV